MTKYDSYKDSGVEWIGDIPNHWSLVKIKHITNQIVDGTHFTPEYIDSGIPFLRVTDISTYPINLDNVKYISTKEHSELTKRCKPEKGDLLLSKNGTIGVTRIIDWDWEFSIFVSLCLLKFNGNYLPELFSFFFQSDIVNQQISDSCKTSTVTNLHLEKIRELILIKPTISEQHQIVKYLDEKTTFIDTLIDKTQQKIETLKELRSSLINKVVTKGLDPNVEMKDSGLVWIGKIPTKWNFVRIGYVSELLTGNPWKSDLFDYDDGIKIVRGENVSEGFLRWGDRTRFWNQEIVKGDTYFLNSGDIIVSMDGSKVGKNYVLIKDKDLPLLLHQRMCRIRVNPTILSEFLSYLIGSEMFRYYIDISKTDPMIPHITQKDISDFFIPLPNTQEQQNIVYYLNEQTQLIDTSIQKEQLRIEKLKEYRQSLISDVVTGKIKVTNE